MSAIIVHAVRPLARVRSCRARRASRSDRSPVGSGPGAGAPRAEGHIPGRRGRRVRTTAEWHRGRAVACALGGRRLLHHRFVAEVDNHGGDHHVGRPAVRDLRAAARAAIAVSASASVPCGRVRSVCAAWPGTAGERRCGLGDGTGEEPDDDDNARHRRTYTGHRRGDPGPRDRLAVLEQAVRSLAWRHRGTPGGFGCFGGTRGRTGNTGPPGGSFSGGDLEVTLRVAWLGGRRGHSAGDAWVMEVTHTVMAMRSEDDRPAAEPDNAGPRTVECPRLVAVPASSACCDLTPGTSPSSCSRSSSSRWPGPPTSSPTRRTVLVPIIAARWGPSRWRRRAVRRSSPGVRSPLRAVSVPLRAESTSCPGLAGRSISRWPCLAAVILAERLGAGRGRGRGDHPAHGSTPGAEVSVGWMIGAAVFGGGTPRAVVISRRQLENSNLRLARESESGPSGSPNCACWPRNATTSRGICTMWWPTRCP